MRSTDRSLLLECARFGDRLRFSVEAAPEVLPVTVPFLSLQPLVENAIRHGMDPERLLEILTTGTPGAGATGVGIGAGTKVNLRVPKNRPDLPRG